MLIIRFTDYPIQPEHLDTDRNPRWFFGSMRSEMSEAAWFIVRFCQARRNWNPFTLEDLQAFAAQEDIEMPVKHLGEFISQNYLQHSGDEFFFTHQFIATAFLASPPARFDPVNAAVPW